MTTRPQLTSADLVPTGQEHGTREATVSGMRQAGLPTSSVGTGTGPVPGPPGAASPVAAPQSVPAPFPADFDTFANREPSGLPPMADGALFRARVEQSQNAVMHDLLTRMDNLAEG